MDILPHPRVTRTLGAPADWDSTQGVDCGALQIADVAMGDGRPGMESLWRPSRAELALLIEGGAIILTIAGTGHPVVSMGVTGPEQLGGN